MPSNMLELPMPLSILEKKRIEEQVWFCDECKKTIRGSPAHLLRHGTVVQQESIFGEELYQRILIAQRIRELNGRLKQKIIAKISLMNLKTLELESPEWYVAGDTYEAIVYFYKEGHLLREKRGEGKFNELILEPVDISQFGGETKDFYGNIYCFSNEGGRCNTTVMKIDTVSEYLLKALKKLNVVTTTVEEARQYKPRLDV